MRSYWEQTIYVIKEQVGDSPIYKVCPETGGEKTRILHINRQHLVNDLPVNLPNPPKNPLSRRGKQKNKCHYLGEYEQKETLQSSESEDSDDETPRVQYWLRAPKRTVLQVPNVQPTCEPQRDPEFPKVT